MEKGGSVKKWSERGEEHLDQDFQLHEMHSN